MGPQFARGGHDGRSQEHEPADATQCPAYYGFFRGEQILIDATHCVESLTRAE